ncbi:neurotrophin receptor-interacting factor 1 isoform X2 [Nematostella vectensis]|uniref:neurotrophin receptor-interacting factor 1 isoform X2 n=1 Tax=Nematostella vectensis TaxID=45351 RepID=UPI0020776216|nr:neurotrophin receptor-interacting factor 1 isoform X2 [Nematostella vectensis]
MHGFTEMSDPEAPRIGDAFQRDRRHGQPYTSAATSRYPQTPISFAELQGYLFSRTEMRPVTLDDVRENEVVNSQIFWCDGCRCERLTPCPIHPASVHHRKPTNSAPLRLSYAIESIPDEVQLCISGIPGAKYGVCTKCRVPQGTWIGPYEGVKINPSDITPETEASYMWEVYQHGRLAFYLDGSDENSSSWMRFIRCARSKEEQNLFAFQYLGNIYYRAFKDIAPGTELLVWYDEIYPQYMGIPLEIRETGSVDQLVVKPDSKVVVVVAPNGSPCSSAPTPPTQPGQPTQPVQAGQAIQPMQAGQAIQPMQEGQPIQTAQAGQAIQPMQAGQPIQTAQAGQAIQPMQAGQAIQPMQSGQAIQPMQSGQAIQPMQSGHPIQPMQAGQAIQPMQSGHPIQPMQSGQAIQPMQAGQAIQPMQSGHPIQPMQAGQAIQPMQAGQAIQPMQAGQAIQHMQAGQAIQPVQAGRPIQTAQAGQALQHMQVGQAIQPMQAGRQRQAGPATQTIQGIFPESQQALRGLHQGLPMTYPVPEANYSTQSFLRVPNTSIDNRDFRSRRSNDFRPQYSHDVRSRPRQTYQNIPQGRFISNPSGKHGQSRSVLTVSPWERSVPSVDHAQTAENTSIAQVSITGSHDHESDEDEEDEEEDGASYRIPLPSLQADAKESDDDLGEKSDGDNEVVKCGQCNQTFNQRSALHIHVCPLVPNKPYHCGYCSESFSNPNELRNHSIVHANEKPFRCGYCSRSFSGATTLNNHIRTHTGEKPFMCEACGKTFSQASQLSKHQKIPGDCVSP